MIFTNFYSEVYDQIHSNKEYDFEALQIVKIIEGLKISKDSSILDFGCGTGKHISNLNQAGYKVSGYDINTNMLQKAQSRNRNSVFYNNYVEIPKIHSFSYSLFDVLSYQILDEEIEDFFNEISGIVLNPGWIMLDGWHLPGLIKSPPVSRRKTFQHLNENLSREVLVSTEENFRITKLDINISSLEKNKSLLSETHFLRAFESNEITRKIKTLGGTDVNFFDGTDYSKPLSVDSWRFAVLFKI
jgi:SAM-dependent methyltransferase